MSTAMTGDRNGGLARFLRWWGGELSRLAPRRRPSWTRAKLALRIEPGAEGEMAVLYRRGWRGEKAQRRILLEDAAEFQPGAGLGDPPPDGPVLLLSRDQVLSRRLNPPRAAEPRLEEVLRLDMATRLPFGPEEAYFDYRVLGRGAKTLDVELVCIARSRLDRWRAALAGAGLAPAAATLGGEMIGGAKAGRPIDLLREFAQQRWAAGAPRRLWLFVLLAALCAAALWQPYEARRQQIALLTTEASALRVEARAALALQEEIEAIAKQEAGLKALLQGDATRLSLLAAATAALPDGAHLRRLEIEGGKLRLDGEAAEAAPLIAAIEASPAFSNASFLSPVIRASGGAERFQIGADIARTGEGP